MKRFNLRIFNNIYSVGIAGLAVYILVSPFIPQFQLWLDRRSGDGFVYQTRLNQPTTEGDSVLEFPDTNRLVLPGIRLDHEILESNSAGILAEGIWRKPNSSTPNQGGNTVIVGHRFTYNEGAEFYHLDKISVGDEFPLYWQGVEYNYKVFEVRVVEPTELSIEDQTNDPILTLYTCTPLWTSNQRLVIRAELTAVYDPENPNSESSLLTEEL